MLIVDFRQQSQMENFNAELFKKSPWYLQISGCFLCRVWAAFFLGINQCLHAGLPRGGGRGKMTPGPMEFRRPMGFREAHHGALGFRGPSRGPISSRGGPSKWHWEISMCNLKAFFLRSPKFDRKTVRISVKTFFFWRSPKIDRKNR